MTRLRLLKWLNIETSKSEIYRTLRGKSGVYMFICNVTNKLYIGSSINLADRMKQYYSPRVRSKEGHCIYKYI